MHRDIAEQPAWQLYGQGQRWGFLAILFLVSLSNNADRTVMSVLLEPIKLEFDVSDAKMGLLSGFAFAAFYAVLGLPVARLADRKDRRLIITLALAAWSVMTMLCGVARTFPQLFLTRMGVGVGEVGAIPLSQSLIADYFPPAQRARALAIFISASTVGYLIAFGVGAHLAAAYGWRSAFIALGAPGLLLCLLTWVGLKEPRRLPGRAVREATNESLVNTCKALARKRSFVLLVVAMVLFYLVTNGAVSWFPAYMVRVLKLSLADTGVAFGLTGAVGSLTGTLCGGWLLDKLAVRDARWLGWLPSLLMIVTWPIYTLALLTDDFTLFLSMTLAAGITLGAAVPALFTLLHRICGSQRRALAVAIILFFANLLGGGFGPLITGAVSDVFTASMGSVGLRYALLSTMAILVPAALTPIFIVRSLERDSES